MSMAAADGARSALAIEDGQAGVDNPDLDGIDPELVDEGCLEDDFAPLEAMAEETPARGAHASKSIDHERPSFWFGFCLFNCVGPRLSG